MPRLHRKPRYVEDHKPELREAIESGSVETPSTAELVLHDMEQALRFAQQGQWDRAQEWRDQARKLVDES